MDFCCLFFAFLFEAEACFDSRCDVQNGYGFGFLFLFSVSVFSVLYFRVGTLGEKFSCLYARFAGAYSMNLHTFSLNDSFSLY